MAAIKKPVVLAKNLLILIFSLRRYVIEKSMINDEKPTIPNLIKTEKIDLILKLNNFMDYDCIMDSISSTSIGQLLRKSICTPLDFNKISFSIRMPIPSS